MHNLKDLRKNLNSYVKSFKDRNVNFNIKDFKKNTELVRITSAGLNESHVHGISITRESPNYQINK